MKTGFVRNYSYHATVSNPFWVYPQIGRETKGTGKGKYVRLRNNACCWQGFAMRKLSTIFSFWHWHAASWHFCGVRWEPASTSWAVVNIRCEKNREEKCIESYNIDFQGRFISTKMVQIFLGIGTHAIGNPGYNYKSFKVYEVLYIHRPDMAPQKPLWQWLGVLTPHTATGGWWWLF